MKNLYLVAALSLFTSLAIVARAEDAERVSKPSVCLRYEIAKPGVAICYDGKKPAIYSRFAEVVIPGQEGGQVKALVGWR